jgi:hypothetical protein
MRRRKSPKKELLQANQHTTTQTTRMKQLPSEEQ